MTGEVKPAFRLLGPYLSGFLLYTLAVILFGALVRATGSGAGCGAHWPLCNGELVPDTGESKTWVEYTHRVTSGLCWFLALGLMLLSRAGTHKGHPLRRWSAVVLLLMTTEALIGAGLVVFEKVAEDASLGRAFWMSAHLINTFFLLASLMLCWCYRRRPEIESAFHFRGRPGGLVFTWWASLAAVGLVGMSGAIAALGDTLFPAATLSEGLAADLSPSAHLFVRLRVFHPVIAIGSVALTVGLAGAVLAMRDSVVGRRFAAFVVIVGLLQLGVGALNVYLLAPVWLQLVHLAFADVLWLSLVGLGFHVFGVPEPESLRSAPQPSGDRQFAPG